MFDFYTQVYKHERMMLVKNIFEFYGLTEHVIETGTDYDSNCIFGTRGHLSDNVEMCTLCNHCQQLLKTNINTYNHSNG